MLLPVEYYRVMNVLITGSVITILEFHIIQRSLSCLLTFIWIMFILIQYLTGKHLSLGTFAATTVDSKSVPYGNNSRRYSTFTGTYQYNFTNGNVCYITFSLSGGVVCKSVFQYVKVKNRSGADNTPLSASASNVNNISFNTPTFYDDSSAPYTNKGYYYYKVDSSNYPYGDSNIVWSKTIT